MERQLLLLGLLRTQEMHGYQLHDAIDAHLGETVQLSRPTAYRLLDRMASKGWISFRKEQKGSRPPRRVYVITEQGEAAFLQLLHDCLANYRPADFTAQISFAFLDELPPGEAVPLLNSRRAAVEALADRAAAHGEHPGSMQLMIDHQAHLLAAELAWLDTVIADIEARHAEETVAGADQ